jgi:hypothetical protein
MVLAGEFVGAVPKAPEMGGLAATRQQNVSPT